MLLNLIKHRRPDIDKNYLYVKDPFESKYQLLINGKEKVGIESPKAFIDCSQTIDDVYEKKRRILIVFDDMIADMESNTKSTMVTEFFLGGRKLNISVVFISQSYFKVPNTIRLNAAHYFIMKTPNKKELQVICLKLVLKFYEAL